MKKRILAILLTTILSITTLVGCGSSTDTPATATTATTSIADTTITLGGTLNFAVGFFYELDAHKDYNGWYSSMYGLTETLYKLSDDFSVVEGLAASATNDGNTWTITLKEGIVFSNGNPVTAEIVIKNFERMAQVNERASIFATATYEAIDERTFSITTQDPCPTLLSELTDPYTSIMDIDNVVNDDYNNGIIATGPFKISSFAYENLITVEKNENYWDGEVALDGANIYYIPDSSTLATSLQSGEIDMYVGPDTNSIQLFSADSNYVVTSVSGTRANYFIYNLDAISDINVRKAIAMAINKDDIITLMGGTLTASNGAFGPTTAIGNIQGTSFDLEGSKALLEGAGYSLNGNGYYEKDGSELNLRISYFAARSIDTITTLIQDQLKNAGINTTLELYEDPDSTYMSTGDFDIAMYARGTTNSGDGYAFLNYAFRTGGSANAGGYSNPEVDSLLDQLAVESDLAKRTELTLQIQQTAVNDYAVCFYGVPAKTTIRKASVSNVCEYNPLTIYLLTKDSSIAK